MVACRRNRRRRALARRLRAHDSHMFGLSRTIVRRADRTRGSWSEGCMAKRFLFEHSHVGLSSLFLHMDFRSHRHPHHHASPSPSRIPQSFSAYIAQSSTTHLPQSPLAYVPYLSPFSDAPPHPRSRVQTSRSSSQQHYRPLFSSPLPSIPVHLTFTFTYGSASACIAPLFHHHGIMSHPCFS